VVAAALSLRDAANRASNGVQEDTLHTVHTHTLMDDLTCCFLSKHTNACIYGGTEVLVVHEI
jgi:hypothetical protein